MALILMSYNRVTDSYTHPLFLLRREQGKTPNGDKIGNRWVLRGSDGVFIDVGAYRSDLAVRHGLDLPGILDKIPKM